VFARGSLKKLYRRDMDAAAAVDVALEALYDAADDDSATGGPDAARGIYPVVAVVEPAGARLLGDDEVAPAALTMLERRRGNPDGGVGGGAA
jgi:proteasome beta subunit